MIVILLLIAVVALVTMPGRIRRSFYTPTQRAERLRTNVMFVVVSIGILAALVAANSIAAIIR